MKGVLRLLSSFQIFSSLNRSIEDKFKANVLSGNLELLGMLNGLPLSIKVTLIPCFDNRHAKEEPTMPAPTIVISESTLIILSFLRL